MLRDRFTIMNYPTVIFFQNGMEADRHLDLAELEYFVDTLEAQGTLK